LQEIFEDNTIDLPNCTHYYMDIDGDRSGQCPQTNYTEICTHQLNFASETDEKTTTAGMEEDCAVALFEEHRQGMRSRSC